MYSGLPPSRMSVPRPAMLVEMVTEPLRPLCATISASLCTFSGFAFSSSYLMPASHVRWFNALSDCCDRALQSLSKARRPSASYLGEY